MNISDEELKEADDGLGDEFRRGARAAVRVSADTIIAVNESAIAEGRVLERAFVVADLRARSQAERDRAPDDRSDGWQVLSNVADEYEGAGDD